MSAPKLRLAVVDEHTVVREGIAAILHDWPVGAVVVKAEDQASYLKECAEVGHIHMVLLTLQMKAGKGFDMLRWLVRNQPRTLPLALTTDISTAVVRHALGCGARAVLHFGVVREELKRAFVQVYGTGYYINELVPRALMRSVQQEEALPMDERWRSLSPAERETVSLFARAGIKDLREVAERRGVSVHTAEAQRRTAYRKLGIRSKPELVRMVVQLGLK